LSFRHRRLERPLDAIPIRDSPRLGVDADSTTVPSAGQLTLNKPYLALRQFSTGHRPPQFTAPGACQQLNNLDIHYRDLKKKSMTLGSMPGRYTVRTRFWWRPSSAFSHEHRDLDFKVPALR